MVQISKQTIEYTLQDVLDAANYGYNYALTSMPEDDNVIPNGNILQWLMNKKNLIETPKEFEQFKQNVK